MDAPLNAGRYRHDDDRRHGGGQHPRSRSPQRGGRSPRGGGGHRRRGGHGPRHRHGRHGNEDRRDGPRHDRGGGGGGRDRSRERSRDSRDGSYYGRDDDNRREDRDHGRANDNHSRGKDESYYGRDSMRDGRGGQGRGGGDAGSCYGPNGGDRGQEPPRFRDNNNMGEDNRGNDLGMAKKNEDNGHYGPARGDGRPRGGGGGDRGPPRGKRGKSAWPQYKINPAAKPDEKLDALANPTPENEDPRGDDPLKRITKKSQKKGGGRNTESFDPASTLVRPDIRVWVGSKDKLTFDKPLKHDDVVIVPNLFGDEEDWSIYYKLVEEMRSLHKEKVKGSEWIPWHEGAHLVTKAPDGSETYQQVIDRLCEYFKIKKESIGTRFNWYRDSSDWKPFHHDSAAYNPQRARTQNITVGVSFGARRELAFLRATPLQSGDKMKLYFPQTNNGVFSFGRDVNILFKHGVNALPEEEQDGKGRISIVVWGLAQGVKEEEGSPPLLGSDGHGPHAQRRDHHNRGHGRRR